MLDVDHYSLINLYNANTESEQCKILNELQSLFNFFDINQNKWIIFAGDFNIFFSSKLEARGGKPIQKRKSIIKLVDIKERKDVCDIWRIRNRKRQNFTFRQKPFHQIYRTPIRLYFRFLLPSIIYILHRCITCHINWSFSSTDLTFRRLFW